MLMMLLFVFGATNLLWIAALSIFVLIEKLTPSGHFARWSGITMLAAGLILLAGHTF